MKKKVKNVVCNTFTLIGFSAIHTNRGSRRVKSMNLNIRFYVFSHSLNNFSSLAAEANNTAAAAKKTFIPTPKWNRMCRDEPETVARPFT